MSNAYALRGISGTAKFTNSPGLAKQALNDKRVLLAKKITRQASSQTYYTIRLLADRPLTGAAYCAYAYFRWVDDILDHPGFSKEARLAFLERQQSIIERCYHADWPEALCPEEELVAELIRSDRDPHSGLGIYINQMMAVMAYDTRRKGQTISRGELNDYTRWLATAVTEALHYFIGHDCESPTGEARYYAVTAAHLTHMLRDAVEDAQNGYYNVPCNDMDGYSITTSRATIWMGTAFPRQV